MSNSEVTKNRGELSGKGAEKDYRIWAKRSAKSQILYLHSIEGIRLDH